VHLKSRSGTPEEYGDCVGIRFYYSYFFPPLVLVFLLSSQSYPSDAPCVVKPLPVPALSITYFPFPPSFSSPIPPYLSIVFSVFFKLKIEYPGLDLSFFLLLFF